MKEITTTKSNQMNIFIVLRDVWHNALFILMAAIIGFSAVTIYGRYVRVPEYTSSSTLVVAAKSTTYANAYAALSTASSMAGVLKEVFESDILMQKVKESEGNLLPESPFRQMLFPERTFLCLRSRPTTRKPPMLSAIQY